MQIRKKQRKVNQKQGYLELLDFNPELLYQGYLELWYPWFRSSGYLWSQVPDQQV